MKKKFPHFSTVIHNCVVENKKGALDGRDKYADYGLNCLEMKVCWCVNSELLYVFLLFLH